MKNKYIKPEISYTIVLIENSILNSSLTDVSFGGTGNVLIENEEEVIISRDWTF